MKRILLSIFLFLLASTRTFALGTYGEGKAIVFLKKLESKGIFFTSYEGVVEVATYDSGEKCGKDEPCYTPQKTDLKFSVRPESKDAVQFLQKNSDRVMVIEYRIHRITPVALSTGFEIIRAYALHERQPGDFPSKFLTKKTGSSANYSVFGKVLRLEYRGTAVGTYEGILYDRKADKIVPFSVTDGKMAEHIYRCMDSMQEYNIGISRAIVAGWRESKLDIFEINYKESAGIQ